MMKSASTASRSSAVHMAVAFIAMGGWAAFANSAHPMPGPLIAGVVQGTLSALITLFLKRMIEALSARYPGSVGTWLPPLVAVLSSLALLSSVHWLAGTPEIVRTMAVPLSVTAVYATVYNLALRRVAAGGVG
ncbi:membrane protein [Stenotrophomonas humi]|uniref:Membrane protein n=2 Tax=Stenotrophomonas humi TaxID=405444 RepID=A0A0R0C840_9GAMM|nr:membrane protein [Stenotrophomonas humi]